MSSWQVRLATALAWLAVLPGLACGYLGLRVLRSDPGFLFAILPIVACILLGAAILLTGFGVAFAGRLTARAPGVRAQTALAGGCLGASGTMVLFVSPVAGLALLLYGGSLLALMCTKGAEHDLGGWTRGLVPRDVWGVLAAKAPARPSYGPLGTTPQPWTSESPQQGPWSPDPTTLPWMPMGHRSGPRTPWWEVWRAGLAQGMPVWELAVVGVSLLVFAGGLVTVLVPGRRVLSLLLMLLAYPGVLVVEQRLRRRLAGR